MRTGTRRGKLTDRLTAARARGEGGATDPAQSLSSDTPGLLASADGAVLSARPAGPYDWSELADVTGYVDLGPILLPAREDVTMRVEVDAGGGSSDLSVHHEGWQMRLDLFSAPRSSGTWEQVADQIVTGLRGQGADVAAFTGVFGSRLEVALVDGERSVPVTVLGIDGPGWLLRATVQRSAEPEDTPADTATSTGDGTDRTSQNPSDGPNDGPIDGPSDGPNGDTAGLRGETGEVLREAVAGDASPDVPGADDAADADADAGADAPAGALDDNPAWHPVGEDGLPSGVLGDVLRAVVVRRSSDPLPVGAALPLVVDSALLGQVTSLSSGEGEPAGQSRFRHLPGLTL